MNKMTLLLSLLAVAACASGKKSEDKSILNKANGENYSADKIISPVPIVKANDRWTTISGKIVFTNPTFVSSTGIQRIELLKNDKLVAQTNSTADGNFEFKGKIANGDYLLKVDSKTLVGSVPLTVKGYKVENVILPAKLGP